jgi:UDP-N-acetylmuramyl tripeptide synthase
VAEVATTDQGLPLRARVASAVSRGAAALSRATGRGDGSVIGGRIGLLIDPGLLANLAAGRRIALVSGTNGKTTTTRLTTAAVGVLGPVATNSFGANMPSGHTSALARAGRTPYAVLEVDEHYLPQVAEATHPVVVALLNLSRDQLDRAKEVAMVAALWRDALAHHPDLHVVANADDPMVVWAATPARPAPPAPAPAATPTPATPAEAAASGAGRWFPAGAAYPPRGVTWFSAGQRWHDDSWVCPECGAAIVRERDQWWCSGCPLRRPRPHWSVVGGEIVDPAGRRHEVKLALPGRVNLGNAATALAVAARFGVRPEEAATRLGEVTSVAGRYAQVERDGRLIRLLLAKNPASWLEAFDMAERAPTVLAVNARGPDGLDTSWLFDVDFAPLRGRPVVVTGDRAYDLAVRLTINEVPFRYAASFSEAVATVPPGRLEVIANYTAFQDIRAELDRVL